MTQPSQNQEVESESVSQEPVELDTPTVDASMRVASPVPNASTRPEPVLLHHADDVQVAHAQHHQISHSQAVSYCGNYDSLWYSRIRVVGIKLLGNGITFRVD